MWSSRKYGVLNNRAAAAISHDLSSRLRRLKTSNDVASSASSVRIKARYARCGGSQVSGTAR